MKSFADYFEIIKFATPETNVRLKNSSIVPKTEEVIIKKCMNWEDIMHLYAADSILCRNNIWVRWYIPYKPFARQDRTTALTHANESEIFEQLYCAYELQQRCIFIDVHSDKHNIGKSIHQFSPIRFYNPFETNDYHAIGEWHPKFHLIVPDAGAARKIPKILEGKVTYCEKKRDPVTGKLSEFIVPEIKTRLPMVLVDDICDGGGTFIGIAEKLQNYRKKNKLILYVTHGIFSKGFEELLKYFDEIVTTNSVLDNQSMENYSYTLNGKLKVLDIFSDDFLQYGLKESEWMI